MSKAHRLKFMAYSKGNATRLSDRLLTKLYQDFGQSASLVRSAQNEYNFDINKVVSNDSKVASVVGFKKRTRLLNINSKTSYSYYGVVKTKRDLSPRYMPKYSIQDIYYDGAVRSYPLDKTIKQVDTVSKSVDIVETSVRKELNRLFIKRYENSTLKILANSRIVFEKYNKAIL